MSALVRCRTVERREPDANVDAGEQSRSAGSGGDRDLGDSGRPPGVDDEITLDETDRYRRRFALTSARGIAFLLDLDHATLLRDGDVLVLDDGRRIVVRAAAEPLYEVRGRGPRHLLTLAWHVGNRHLPTQVMADHLRIRVDPVIGDMLAGLGGQVREIAAGFDPEGGAYDAPVDASTHSHAHAHSHAHRHEHGAVHAPEPEQGQGQGQGLGHGHGHDHGDDHGDDHEHAREHDREHERG